jgi:hypothetical protein
LGRRVMLRDVKLLCKRLGFDRRREHCTPSGIRSLLTTFAVVGRSSIFRRSSGIQRWR